jgi:hypothetical protein
MTKKHRPDEQAVDKIIGRNLRAFRLQKSMSQEQIAAAVKLTFQQVQKYEKGSNRVRVFNPSKITSPRSPLLARQSEAGRRQGVIPPL